MDQTRRALLRTVPLAAAGGLAGCSVLSGDESTDDAPLENGTATSTSTETSDASAERSPTDWLFPPSALGRDHYGFVTLRPSSMLEYADALPEARVSNLRTEIALSGFDTVGSLDGVYQLGGGVVVYDGPFERDPLVTELTEAGFGDVGSAHGFDQYSPDEQRLVAVGEDAVLLVDLRSLQTDATSGDVAGTVLDAVSGEGDRYQDVSDDCATLLDALGDAHVFTGRTGSAQIDDDAAVAQGARWQLGTETTTVDVATVFESADATAPDAVESWATAAGPFGATTPSVSTDGRVVGATADVPTGDLGPFELSSSPDESPQINFAFDYDADAGTVTVTHQGGDAVPAERLELQGQGFADREGTDQTSAGTWAGEASGDGDVVVAGDSVVVGVTPSYRLFVLFTPESGRGATLATDTGPDA